MRRVLGLFVAMMLVLLVAGVATAADPVAMQAEAGFDGRVKPGTWVPVTVTLTNNGPELHGEVVFTTTFNLGPGAHESDYTTPVVLPAGASKKVELLIPTEMGPIPNIQFRVNGEVLTATRPEVESSRDLLVGVLGVEPADLKGLAGAKLSDQAIRVAPLTAASFPTEPLVLDNLDAVLLDRFNVTELSPAQRTALQAWVEAGGTLLLAGGPEAARLNGLAPWVPVALSGAKPVELPGIGKAPLSNLDLKGWQGGHRVDGAPLLATLRKGSGRVVLFAFDPALEPFASWSGLPGLFGEALPTSGAALGPNPMGGMQQGQEMVNLASTLLQMPMGSLPSMRTLLIVLAAYALVLGPVHFLLLKAFRRTGWALLTLPLLVAAGAGGGWLYIRHARASDVLANQIAVVEGQPGGTSARVSVAASFLTPPGAKHQVSLGDALMLSLPAGQDLMMAGTPVLVNSHATVPGGRSVLLDPLERWSNRTVAAKAVVQVGGSVEGAVIIGADQVTGKLTNRLPFAIKSALIIVGANVQKVDRWEPGQTVEIAIAPPTGVTPVNPKMGPAGNILEVVSRETMVTERFPPDGPTPEQQARMRRQQMVWSGLAAANWVQGQEQPIAAIVGWMDWSPLQATVDGAPLTASGEGMYVQEVAYDFAAGDFTVPAGLLAPKVVKWSGMGFMYLVPGWNPPKGTAVTVDFSVPESLAPRVAHMELQVPVLMQVPSGNEPLGYRFYRWTDATWVEFATETDTVVIDNAAPYVAQDGTVRVEITRRGNTQMPLGTPALSVSGKGVQP